MLRENKQQDADQKKKRELKEDDKAAGQERSAAVPLIFRGQQALHDRLVRPVARHGQKRAADDARPEGIFRRQIPTEIQKPQFVSVSSGNLHNFVPPAGNAMQQAVPKVTRLPAR